MTETRLQQLVGKLLRAGVIAAAAVTLAGGIWFLAAHGLTRPDYVRYEQEDYALTSFLRLPAPERIMMLGLLLLMATPIARVAFTLVAFARAGERVYATLALIVLMLLFYSVGTSWL